MDSLLTSLSPEELYGHESMDDVEKSGREPVCLLVRKAMLMRGG